MALRGTLTHRKTRRLAQAMGIPPCYALGLLEALWHVTGEQAPNGAIGRMTDQDIAMEMFYDGDPAKLIEALRAAELVDSHPEHRLIVHDWHIHSDDATNNRLARATQLYANGEMPRLTKLSLKERALVAARFAEAANKSAHERTEAHKGALPVPNPVPVPEPVKKVQKPSRDKREANPMHAVFKGLVQDAWKKWGNPLEMPWDGAEGKQLGMLIGANPKLGPDGMRRLLQYRARSNGVNLAERPSKWLRSLTDYARGPLNEFKQPQETSNGTTQGNHKPNAAVDRQRISHDAIIEAGRRRYGVGAAEDDGGGASGQAQPDATAGDAGCIPPGMGGDSPDVRVDDFQGRTLEGTP